MDGPEHPCDRDRDAGAPDPLRRHAAADPPVPFGADGDRPRRPRLCPPLPRGGHPGRRRGDHPLGHAPPSALPAGRVLRTIGERWRDDVAAAQDPELARIRRWLSGGPTAGPPDSLPGAGRNRLAALAARRWTADAWLWRKAEAGPADAAYLHTSHIRLDRPELFRWLDARPDVRPVVFVHDLIPIAFPEYGVPGEALRHRRRMATVAERAAAILVNSADVAGGLDRHLVEAKLRRPPIRVAPLGVERAFDTGVAGRDGRPYFVVCSTIEARKNHLLLLQVWRDLAGRLGPDTPALVVVGRRGWESEAAVDLLDRCEAIRPHVIEASGLSTAGLAELMAGARALLMPSFAEGYSIPIAEALSLGTPAIASDIAVHREVSKGRARLIDPLDGTGWREVIVQAGGDGPSDRVTGYAAPRWEEHFAIVDEVLAGL